MSDNPESVVVDRNCKVHSVANLHVAGSSVFPTSGHANPTLMITALALRALAKVKASSVLFHYTLAGGGPEVPSLRKLCTALGLDDCVEFHPGYRGEDYIAALQRSHVYFLPSFRESTPVTLLEAYLAGCYPVVADTSAKVRLSA